MTIRSRVTAIAAAGVSAVLLVTGTALVLIQRQLLLDNLDAVLLQQAADIQTALAEGAPPAAALDTGQPDDVVLQLVTDAGRVLAGTEGARSTPVAAPVGAATTRTQRLAVDDDDRFRLHSRPVVVDGVPAVLHVGIEADVVTEAAETLVQTLLLAGPLTVLVLSGLVWLLVGRALQPVADLQAEIAAIGPAQLDRRVTPPPAQNEISRLAALVNGMLDRLDAAAAAQRRFTGDAAHELRTPLARLRSEVEVDLAHPGTADPIATHRSVLEEVVGMQALVEDLLLLSRLEHAAHGSRRVPLAVGDLVAQAVATSLAADERDGGAVPQVHVDLGSAADAEVLVDERAMVRALRNLLDNAVRHADEVVQVTARTTDGWVEVGVADDGPGIPPEHHQTVFERFTRLDGARAADQGGTGLGLAITREVVAGHGGTVGVDAGWTAGARLVIRLARHAV